jgi:hypothetical protein
MDTSAMDMQQTVTMILQGLEHLAGGLREAETPAEEARGADLPGLAPALAALVRALGERE